MERHLHRAGLTVVECRKFTILHSQSSLMRQLRVGQSKLPLMNAHLRPGFEEYFKDLECVDLISISCLPYARSRIKTTMESTDSHRIPLSFDYVIVAKAAQEPSPSTLSEENQSKE